jgi:hypothetical protein
MASHRHMIAVGLVSWSIAACQVYDAQLLSDEPGRRSLPNEGVETGELDGRIQTRCGDGVISGPEKCDTGIEAGEPGACPTQCLALEACSRRALNGTACQAECVVLELVCQTGDGCCAGNCNAAIDRDCSSSCGNGKVDSDQGETCELGSSSPCPTSASECADTDPCTRDTLNGSAANCNAQCRHVPIVEASAGDGCCPPGGDNLVDADCLPRCGNGVREGDEACDGTPGCSEGCEHQLMQEQLDCLERFVGDECERCSCLNCTAPYAACRGTGTETEIQLCRDVIDCAREENCVGTPCYCGELPLCAIPRGPCRTEIEAAAGSSERNVVTAQNKDPESTLGRATATATCRVEQCYEACRSKRSQLIDL